MTEKEKPRTVKIGLVQSKMGADVEKNRAHVLKMVEQAAIQGAQIICTPELFCSEYFCQSEDHKYFEFAEEIPNGPTTKALQELAKKRGVVIVGSIFEKRAPGIFHNTAVIIDADGAYLGSYRKMHIPDDPLFYEKFYFTPGDLGFRAWKTKFATIGVLICWDQWYPEGARLTALQGAEILFYPTAIGLTPGERQAGAESEQHSGWQNTWETIQRSHAIANGCYVAVPNRIGLETPAGGDGLVFWGGSFVADTSGNVLKRASDDKEEVLVVPVDLDAVGETRTYWPFFRDRRIDAYDGITQRWLGKG